MHQFAKHIRPLAPQTEAKLKSLSNLDLSTYNETDVREAFLAPLIEALGYSRGTDYTVFTEQQYALNPLFVSAGSKRIKLDYQFATYRTGFWLLEAKKGLAADSTQPPAITSEMIGQAHFYAHHHEIDCPLFGVSNGWFTNIYDRDAEDPLQAVLSIPQSDLVARFKELYELIGFDQLTFGVKRRLMKRIEQVLSAEVDLSRGDEFIRAVESAVATARPQVLENFRKAASHVEAERQAEFDRYIDGARTWETIDTLLQAGLSIGDMSKVSTRLADRVAEYPGSNQFLFFHKLLLVEPRAVTTDYYFNALTLLGNLTSRADLQQVSLNGGLDLTDITKIYADFVELLVFHLEARPELQLIWALEALTRRLCKRLLISTTVARNAINAQVDLQRYFNSEEQNAFLGPSPARTLLQSVEMSTLASIGRFFARYYNDRSRSFRLPEAMAEYKELERTTTALEAATDDAYIAMKKSLGSDWSELTFIDSQNRSFDRLGHAVCEIVGARPALFPALSDRTWDRIRMLASLNNPFAVRCLEAAGRVVPAIDPLSADKLKVIFDPAVNA